MKTGNKRKNRRKKERETNETWKKMQHGKRTKKK